MDISTFNDSEFGEIHTSSYGLVLSKKTIEAPSPKLETVDIPGADGKLDMTEYFGDVKYNNRKIKLEFSTELLGNRQDYVDQSYGKQNQQNNN